MTRPSPVWRAIVWIERFLPKLPASAGTAESKPGRDRSGLWMLAALLPMTVVNLITTLHGRSGLAGDWSVWRPLLLDGLLVAAGACLVAIAAAVVIGWREARRHRDA